MTFARHEAAPLEGKKGNAAEGVVFSDTVAACAEKLAAQKCRADESLSWRPPCEHAN
jgi:hypothetical protein